MHKLLYLISVFTFQLFFLQSVTLNKVEKTNDNKDKFLYRIAEISHSEYLGEILVNGFSNDDVRIFGEVYKKAKQIGANSFSLKPIENVDGTFQKFDPSYYMLNLYYTEPGGIREEDNVAYLVSAADKKQKITIDNETVEMQPRHFFKLKLKDQEVMTVSTRKLLGSTVKLSGKTDQPALYFSLTNFNIRSNDSVYGGINLKSGDITGLEKSFGMFLTTIYTEQKLD